MKVDDITESELWQAVAKSLQSADEFIPGLEPGTVTRPKLVEKKRISVTKAQRILDRLCADGIARPDLVVYTDPWGYKQRVKGYRLVEQEGASSG
jgi:hypothetical protein